jgi:hypothetical protein
MKRIITIIALAITLTACAPSLQVIQTAVAGTLEALPSQTPFYPTYDVPAVVINTVIVTVIVTEAFTPTPLYTPTITSTPTKTQPPTKTPNLAQTATANQLASLRSYKSDGNFLVGVDIAPGVWRNSATGECYWEITTRTGDIINNYFGAGGGTAYISTTAFAFRSEDCGTWTFLSAP